MLLKLEKRFMELGVNLISRVSEFVFLLIYFTSCSFSVGSWNSCSYGTNSWIIVHTMPVRINPGQSDVDLPSFFFFSFSPLSG
jgi:hypothetical protein